MRALFWSALKKYRTMRRRRTTRIRLMSDADAEIASEPSTRVAHLTTLFAAALHGDHRHDVSFLPARTRTAEEEAALREVAKVVYLSYTDEAMEGLKLICDANVHFRWPDRPLATRLLCSVATELPDAPKPDIVQTEEFVMLAAVRLNGGEIEQHDPTLGPLQ
jgi:hypothetical protein